MIGTVEDIRFDLSGYDDAVLPYYEAMEEPSHPIGYRSTDSDFNGLFVPWYMAEEYALRQCGLEISNTDAPDHKEALKTLVEWYFSGPWIPIMREE
jgi:hypothetical protein